MTDVSNDRWVAGDAYEQYMGRWSRPLARKFVEWLHPHPSGHWLEIGCGTGALTSAICELGEPASVIACDQSAPFVDHARKTLSDPRVTFLVTKTFQDRDGGFDAIVSGLVLNFLPDVVNALSGMRERARPGGVVAAYVWDYAEGMEFLRAFWDHAVALDPQAAALDEGQRFPLCNQARLAAAFSAAGFQQVETGALEISTVFIDFAQYWTPFLQGTGPAPSYVASLDPAQRRQLEERLAAKLCEDDGQIRLRARAWAVRGIA